MKSCMGWKVSQHENGKDGNKDRKTENEGEDLWRTKTN